MALRSIKFNNQITNILAGCLLILMFGLAFLSMRGDSTTMDELAHTPAGYSYISQKDMRLNPEHPPLLKDLAGLSAWLGSKITVWPIYFPSEVKSWQEDINGQWNFGGEFLYRAGNDADKIIFWSRLPMLLLMLLLGVYVFKWASQLYGNRAGLLALFLYFLSPTFLAHGRLVTTDVGAAAAFFIASYYLIKWLKESNQKNLIMAGLVFGLALLTKFSLPILLIPYFIFLTVVWSLLEKKRKKYFPHLLKRLFLLLLIGLIGMALVWPVYQFHVWNYPTERQKADTEFILTSFGGVFGARQLADSVVWMSDKPILRPYAQFFLGLLMVTQRALGGNTTYFLGEVSAAGWRYYFPVVFLIKVPLAFLILILITILTAAYQIKKPFWQKPYQRISQWVKDHFTEFALLSFLALYWLSSVTSNLNIGVRHVLPTFPILYLLISGQIVKWLRVPWQPILEKVQFSLIETLKALKKIAFLFLKTYFKYLLLIILLLWYAFGTIKIYPHFLAYFNELVGGADNGYKYVTDSNLDWGQDLKRLTQFVEDNNIETIYINYFGGSSAQYYLGEKFQDWWGDRDPNDLPSNGWLAISATLLQGGRGLPAPGFRDPTGYYNWLNRYEPVTVIGHSIFVYNIK